MFVNRRSECAVLDQLLQGARDGRSGALVVRGAPGVGKTALLEYAIQSASDLRVVHVVGVESEMELAFAGLHQLCAPMLDRLERLPDPQREALSTAFGLAGRAARPVPRGAGGAGSAVGGRRGAAAGVRRGRRAVAGPCVRAGARVRRAAAAGRVGGDGLRGARAAADAGARAGCRSLPIEGLAERRRAAVAAAPSAGRSTSGCATGSSPRPAATRSHCSSCRAAMTPAELAGGFGLLDRGALASCIERELPAAHRAAAGRDAAAAAARGRRAARRRRAAVARGRAARHPRRAPRPGRGRRAVGFGSAVRFRHPLVRSAVYRAAPPAERRASTGRSPRRPTRTPIPIAARGTSPRRPPGRTRTSPPSWSAPPAARRARGGVAAAAAFLERATELTPDAGAARAARALAAAQAKRSPAPRARR